MKKIIRTIIITTCCVMASMMNAIAQSPILLKTGLGNATMLDCEAIGNTFYFKVSSGSFKQLWKTDGTAAGTQMVKDSFAVDIINLVSMNSTLYFVGVSSGKPALWKSDGTAAGTIVVKNFTDNSPSMAGLTVINNTGYFIYSHLGPSYTGLWKTDGTDAGTVEIKSGVSPGSALGSNYFFQAGSEVIFFGSSAASGYRALWKTDGTAAGTIMYKDSVIHYGLGNTLTEYVNANDKAFYTVSSGAGNNLWRTDGTLAGTFMVGSGTLSNLTNLNGTVYFRSFSISPPGYSLWKSDGTTAGTVGVSGVDNVGLSLSTTGNNLYLGGKTGFDWEPYKSDGTAAGTVLLKDINPGTTGSNPQYFTKVNNMMCFTADDGIHGYEIWKSDGTTAGTIMAYALADTITNFSTVGLTAFNNSLLFISAGADLYSLSVAPTSTGINESLRSNNTIKIFPNPSSGIIHIEWDGDKFCTLQVLNIMGEEVLREQISTEANLSNLPEGIYYVRISSANLIQTQKLIIQK